MSKEVIFVLMTAWLDFPTDFLRVWTRSNLFFRSRSTPGPYVEGVPSSFKRNWERRRVTPFTSPYPGQSVNYVDVNGYGRPRSRSRVPVSIGLIMGAVPGIMGARGGTRYCTWLLSNQPVVHFCWAIENRTRWSYQNLKFGRTTKNRWRTNIQPISIYAIKRPLEMPLWFIFVFWSFF